MVIVSYVSGSAGGVTSEWVDDKLRVLDSWGRSVTLVTGPRSKLLNTRMLKIRRAYSLGWIDFSSETIGKPRGLIWWLLFPWATTVGRLFDWLFLRLAGSYSQGFWSWIPMAFWHSFIAVLRDKDNVLLTTGGPSSAHFVGLLTKLCLPKTKLFVEHQDPFIGTEMRLSPRAMKVMIWLEHLLIHNATKVVYVTKVAAARAGSRHNGCPKVSSIEAVYPGSWNFNIRKPLHTLSPSGPTFLHLGTLYSNRNLDNFFLALDKVIECNPAHGKQVKVVNLGNLALGNASEYMKRRYFSERPIAPRVHALREAVQADFLLLVQHVDSRSEETIPYKTYDYLNLKIPIFALTANAELESLILGSGGYVAQSGDVDSIEESLKLAIEDFRNRSRISSTLDPIVIEEQVSLLLNRDRSDSGNPSRPFDSGF